MDYARQRLNEITSQYKLTPATLAHKLNPSWIPAAHLKYISAKIAHAVAKGDGRLIISAPPRHGKSELVTTNVPIWALEHFPDKEIVLTTYGAELSTDFGRKVRDICINNEHLLNLRVRQDASKASNWSTHAGGSMRSIGLGGAITGRGADVLIIDDYIKEVKEALSPAHHNYLWDWFCSVALTRIEPRGSIIIIATRWHHNDLIGRILKHKEIAGLWDYIQIPALAMENDVLGRHVGEPLFPERYDLNALVERQITLGTYWFNAMYQQDPRDESAKLTNVDWLQYVDSIANADRCRYVRVWDFASTAGAGDYTVGTLAALDDQTEHMTLCNIIRKQISANSIQETVRKTALADGHNTIIYIEQEPGASGKLLFEHYKNNVLPEFTVMPIPATENKVVRAQPFLAACEAGKVSLLRGAWNELFAKEFEDFPDGDNDDQVDTAANAYERLSRRRSKAGTFGRNTGTPKPKMPGLKKSTFGRKALSGVIS